MSEIRTPPSLKWLLDKRSRLMGRIARLKKSNQALVPSLLDKIKAAEENLTRLKSELIRQQTMIPVLVSSLEKDLEAIDRPMSMHEIQINPSIIPSINSQEAPRFIAYGAITRHIYKYLTKCENNSASSLEVAIDIAINFSLNLTDKEFTAFKINIRHRLKALMHEGKLIRLPTPKRAHSQWALPRDPNAPKPKWLTKEARLNA